MNHKIMFIFIKISALWYSWLILKHSSNLLFAVISFPFKTAIKLKTLSSINLINSIKKGVKSNYSEEEKIIIYKFGLISHYSKVSLGIVYDGSDT